MRGIICVFAAYQQTMLKILSIFRRYDTNTWIILSISASYHITNTVISGILILHRRHYLEALFSFQKIYIFFHSIFFFCYVSLFFFWLIFSCLASSCSFLLFLFIYCIFLLSLLPDFFSGPNLYTRKNETQAATNTKQPQCSTIDKSGTTWKLKNKNKE